MIGIEEKPKNPKSNLAVTGLYIYDSDVFDAIKTLKPSGRGELEISDVNNYYINKGMMEYGILEGFWSDAGTFESLLRASILVQQQTRIIDLQNEIDESENMKTLLINSN